MAIFMTTADWISTAGVAVQLLLLCGLIVYCVETYKIRKISQAQLEAMHAPCITFHATPRDAAEAIPRRYWTWTLFVER